MSGISQLGKNFACDRGWVWIGRNAKKAFRKERKIRRGSEANGMVCTWRLTSGIAGQMEMSGACKSDAVNAVDEEVVHLPIRCSGDVVAARQKGRELAIKLGFAGSEV